MVQIKISENQVEIDRLKFLLVLIYISSASNILLLNLMIYEVLPICYWVSLPYSHSISFLSIASEGAGTVSAEGTD